MSPTKTSWEGPSLKKKERQSLPILFALFRHQLSLLRSRLALIRSEKRRRKGSVHRRIGRGKGGPQSSKTTIQGKTRGPPFPIFGPEMGWTGAGRGKVRAEPLWEDQVALFFLSLGQRERRSDRPTDGRTDSDVVCVPIASATTYLLLLLLPSLLPPHFSLSLAAARANSIPLRSLPPFLFLFLSRDYPTLAFPPQSCSTRRRRPPGWRSRRSSRRTRTFGSTRRRCASS